MPDGSDADNVENDQSLSEEDTFSDGALHSFMASPRTYAARYPGPQLLFSDCLFSHNFSARCLTQQFQALSPHLCNKVFVTDIPSSLIACAVHPCSKVSFLFVAHCSLSFSSPSGKAGISCTIACPCAEGNSSNYDWIMTAPLRLYLDIVKIRSVSGLYERRLSDSATSVSCASRKVTEALKFRFIASSHSQYFRMLPDRTVSISFGIHCSNIVLMRIETDNRMAHM